MVNSIRKICDNERILDKLERNICLGMFNKRYISRLFKFRTNKRSKFMKKKVQVRIYVRVEPYLTFMLYKIFKYKTKAPKKANQVSILIDIKNESSMTFKCEWHRRNRNIDCDLITDEDYNCYPRYYPAGYFNFMF